MNIYLQYHWSRLNPATLPLPHCGSSMVFDQKHQQSVLVTDKETWVWNDTNWSLIHESPPARSTTHLVYDAHMECVLLFGGIGLDGTPLNDTWLWNGSTWAEQHPADFPSAVGGAAIAYDSAQRQVILFGGITNFEGTFRSSTRVGTFLNEMWVWNGITWEEQHTSIIPPERAYAQLIYDEQRQEVLLVGGNNLQGYLNDMWSWNGTSWEHLHPAMLPPIQARYSSVFHDQLQQAVLFGEVITSTGWMHSIWLWDGTTWSFYASNAVPSGSIEGLTYDRTRHAVFANVVGGRKASLGNKASGAKLPGPHAPTFTSEIWVWK